MSTSPNPPAERTSFVPVLLPEVTPVPGEFGVYLVESRSRPGIQHRVDVLFYNGNGACGCEHFEIKIKGKLERGANPSFRLKCRHLAVAREVFGIEMAMAYSRMKREERKNAVATKAKENGPVGHDIPGTDRREYQMRDAARVQKAGTSVQAVSPGLPVL